MPLDQMSLDFLKGPDSILLALQTTWSASQYSKLNKILTIHQQMGMAGFQAHLFTKTGREPDSMLGPQFADHLLWTFPLELNQCKQSLREGA